MNDALIGWQLFPTTPTEEMLGVLEWRSDVVGARDAYDELLAVARKPLEEKSALEPEFLAMLEKQSAEYCRYSLGVARAKIKDMRALLGRCHEREYNPFEPSNQSRLYHDLVAMLIGGEKQ